LAKIIEGEINSHGIDLVRSFFLIVINIIISSFLIYLFVLDEFLSSVLLWFLGLLILCVGVLKSLAFQGDATNLKGSVLYHKFVVSPLRSHFSCGHFADYYFR